MARYIDADRFRVRVKTQVNPYGKPTLEYASGLKVLTMIDNEPTADVEEVRHGEWLIKNLCGERICECSECKTLGSPMWKRCPVCEAKMDGGKNETR